MHTRAEVYAAIDSERAYQEMRIVRDASTAGSSDATINTNGDPRPHSPEEFLIYTQHYLNEAIKVASTVWGPDAKLATMETVRKVAALCVANMEANGAPRRKGF